MLRHKKANKKEFFEKITINREVVVQEAGFTYVIISRKGTENKSEVWVEQMKPVNSQVPDSRLGRQILETFWTETDAFLEVCRKTGLESSDR